MSSPKMDPISFLSSKELRPDFFLLLRPGQLKGPAF